MTVSELRKALKGINGKFEVYFSMKELFSEGIKFAIVYILIIILAMFISNMFAGCGELPPQNVLYFKDSEYKVGVIDNCEYILFARGLAHKGNCKFCIERNKLFINFNK